MTVRSLPLLSLALVVAAQQQDDVYFTLEVQDVGPTSTVDGTHRLQVPWAPALANGETPLARVRSFGRAAGFTGAQQQAVLDHVCNAVGYCGNDTVIPKLSDYLVDGDELEAKVDNRSAGDSVQDDGRPAGAEPWLIPVPSNFTTTSSVIDELWRPPPRVPQQLPDGMLLRRSVTVSQLGYEIFVVDNVTTQSTIEFWAKELDVAPFRRGGGRPTQGSTEQEELGG